MERQVFALNRDTYEKECMVEAVGRIFEAFGGIPALLKKGDRVLLKPNLLMARAPGAATTTHPDLVYAAAKLLTEAGARVTIADSPGGPYGMPIMGRIYKTCGMTQAAADAGAALNRDFSSREVTHIGVRPRRFELITPVLTHDVIINLCKMKSHMFMHFTGAVKNHFGTIPGIKKAAYHSMYPEKEDFADMLLDLCMAVNADLHIMDGIEGMDGKGPSGGRVRQCGLLLASKNPVALDQAAMVFCGIDPLSTPVHASAVRAGLAGDFELFGEPILPLSEPFDMPMGPQKSGVADRLARFTPPFLRRAFLKGGQPLPVFSDRCIGCGDCARACPQHAIEIRDSHAVLTPEKCIRCYCCHELCPVQAVDL